MANPVIQMRTAAETALIERFAAQKPALPGAVVAREAAFARFEALGLPTRRVESYHYTDLRNLMRGLAPDAGPEGIQAAGEGGRTESQHNDAALSCKTALTLPDTSCITFVNGRLQGAPKLPAGVSLEPLDAALKAGQALNAAFGSHQDVVVDLNTALCRHGARIRVAAGATIAAPLHLAFIEALNGPASLMPRVIVEIGAGASLVLVESHDGPDSIAYQTNDVLEFIIAERATLEHIRLSRAGDAALALSNVMAILGADSAFSSVNVALGAAVSRHQVFVTYAGENAKASIRGATMIRGQQHADTTLIVDHAVPGGESRELFRSVIDGAAQGVFQGKIIVRPLAQKTDGQMASNALLLSDEAGMSNKPELEIFADDVVCAHGATCGALDENQLFYLMARGLPRAEAEALLVEAFLDETLDGISHDGLRAMLQAEVSVWMKGRPA